MASKHLSRTDVEVGGHEELHRGYFQIDRYNLKFRHFSGDWSPTLEREVILARDGVGVLLVDPERDEVVLIRQFRAAAYAVGDESPWLTEIVAGDIEAGETPDRAALRESREEAGAEPTDLVHISSFYPASGAMTGMLHLFVARVDQSAGAGVHGTAHEGENIECFRMPVGEAIRALLDGRIRTGPAFAALAWLSGNRAALAERWGAGDGSGVRKHLARTPR